MQQNNLFFPQLRIPNEFQQKRQQEPDLIDKYMTKIAKQMGGSCLAIYEDIKKYKEKYNDLSEYKFPLLRYEKIKTESNVCARILTKDVKAFKCHDCIYQSNSIMCVDCFQNSDHKGHIYELIRVYGGCCDCGDEQKWNPKGSCRKHNDPNLVQQIKKQVNAKQQKQFVQQLSFCFIYFFLMYNDAEEYLKGIGDENNQDYKNRLNFLDKYCLSLVDYLQQFNTNSLVSNIMTYRTLASHIYLLQSQKFQLSFCPKTSQYPIFQIILKCTKLRKSCESIVNLFTQLFTLRQFKRQLTVTYAKLYYEDQNFAMSGFNHLSCQLLTSHKLIRQLVQNKQIRPFVYKPSNDIKDFEVLAHNYVRYYIDIEYLSKLYKESSQIYLTYHINEGYLPTLASYRIASLMFDETISYYGIQEIYLNKLSKIMIVIYNSKKSLKTLQKAMQDLFKQCSSIYSLHYDQFFNEPMTDDLAAKYIYISHQLSLSMVIFAYIQKLDQQEGQKLALEQRIQKIMKILNLTKTSDNKNKILGILKIVHSNLILFGLILGHPQTMERFYTFFSFTYKKSLKSISLLFYLYKILLLMLKSICEHISTHQNTKVISTNFISDTIFQRPFNLIEQLLNQEDFEDDDENIFDRKKCLIRLIYFLNLSVQALETDTHELILAQALGINKKQKFETKTMKFYLELLKNYKKIGLKQFKQITDSFFVDDQVFQKFIAQSKDIVLNNGKIELKQLANERQFSRGQRKLSQNQDNNQLNKKISSQINIHYFKSFKNKLTNAGQKQYELKVPSSENHLLYLVISQNFVNKVLKIVSAYTDLISLNQGKIKDRETGTLSLLIIEVVKICKALKGIEVNGVDYGKISQEILKFFKGLQAKKNSLNIFTQDIIKMICQLLQNEESLSSLQKSSQQQEQKAQQRKKKLQQKKSKKLAKFKQNQQKCQQKYSSQIKNIRQQIEEQNLQQNLQNGQQAKKFCIICRQNYNEKDITNSDIALMGYMQLTDLYYYLFKGKTQQSKNCNLMFKTCGHYIHMACHNKINGNKQYSLCQLCKSTVNCLLPINVFQYNYQTFIDNPISYILKKTKQTNQHIYKELKNTYNRLYIIDVVLRQNCENGYGKDLQDEREIKEKLIESLINQMVIMFVELEQQKQKQLLGGRQKMKFFEKKVLSIYKNILFGLKVFIKCQQEENLPKNKVAFKKIKKNQEEEKVQDPFLIKLDEEDSNIELEKNSRQLEKQKQKTENQGKDKIVYEKLQKIQRFVAKWIDNFIYDVKESEEEDFGLSKVCVESLIGLLNRLKQQELIEEQKVQEQNQMMKKPQAQSQANKVCEQVTLLSPLIRFFTPPQKLQQLIKQRGKCPNCLRITNHIMICFICEWRGCRQCKKQSIFDHNNKMHNGNSIYLSADLGNIYYVSRKKYWVYNSLYEDYLGNHLGEYHLGVKLDKYTINKSRLKKIYKHLMNYEIESVIRYEEYDKKRQFTQNI